MALYKCVYCYYYYYYYYYYNDSDYLNVAKNALKNKIHLKHVLLKNRKRNKMFYHHEENVNDLTLF